MRLSWCVLPIVVAALATAVPSRAEELASRAPVPSRILLDLQRREISVVLDGRMRGSWPVAIGDPKTPTPQGGFSILTKKVNPIYVSNKSGQRQELSGPTSPIGDRYLAFHRNSRGEFGIHGTPWPHWVKIRAAVSLGCVRMLNDHVRQLFDLVDVGTSLEIRG
jgi:lipoprotein-anchoring transpeptidase ErfK/SrfK